MTRENTMKSARPDQLQHKRLHPPGATAVFRRSLSGLRRVLASLRERLQMMSCPVLSSAAMVVLVAVLPAHSAVAEDPIACFSAAAERHNIPVELLVALAEAESGLRPFAMNRAGVAVIPANRAEAERLVQQFGAQRPTFDIGIMQVNRWWFEKYREPYEKGFDLCFNVDFGARILALAIKDHGFTWQAVGRYHSPTAWRQDRYAHIIYSRLVRILEKRKGLPFDQYLSQRMGLSLPVKPAQLPPTAPEIVRSSQPADSPEG